VGIRAGSLRVLGGCWEELSAKGNREPQEASEQARTMVSLASVS
jgi:hypothetical protein